MHALEHNLWDLLVLKETKDLPKEILDEIKNLVDVVYSKTELKNGKTALYWHLVYILEKHIDNQSNLG